MLAKHSSCQLKYIAAKMRRHLQGVKAALGSGADVNATSSHEYIRGLAPLQVALLTTSEPFWCAKQVYTRKYHKLVGQDGLVTTYELCQGLPSCHGSSL